MPWCPKCKNEYGDGITICADCKVTLIDSLDSANNEQNTYELAQIDEKATAIRLVKYLKYSGIHYADIRADSNSKCYSILVSLSEKNSAMKYYNAFLDVEEELSLQAASDDSSSDEDSMDDFDEEDSLMDSEEDFTINSEEKDSLLDSESEVSDSFEESDEIIEDFNDLEEFSSENQNEPENDMKDIESPEYPSSGSAYVMKEDAYKEHRSTASMFYVFSIAGLIFLGLNVAGVIQYVSGLFSYLVMGALFIAFFYFGIYSSRKAKEISTGIDAENELTQKINTYLNSLGEIPSMDEADWSSLNDELLYFKRTTKLKQMVIKKFGAQNEAYLDVIIEEFYNANV